MKRKRLRQLRRRALARTGAPDGLSDRQLRALGALLAAPSTAAAARITGISRRSLVRWKNDPTFRQLLADASRARLDEAKDSLRAATVEAVEVLRAALRNGTRAERIRASTAILDLARRLDGAPDERPTARARREPEITRRDLSPNVIIVGGTEDEYIAALNRLRWSNGDFDADDSPEKIAAWRAEHGLLPAASGTDSDDPSAEIVRPR